MIKYWGGPYLTPQEREEWTKWLDIQQADMRIAKIADEV